MAFVVERITSQPHEVDSQGIKRQIRAFTSDYLTRAALQADPVFPALNTPHPDDSTLKADSYRFIPKSDGTLDADVIYTTNGSGKFPKRVDKSLTYKRATAGNLKLVTQSIPIFVLGTKVVTSGSQSGNLGVWEPVEFKIEEIQATAQYKVVVPALGFDNLYAIAEQVGKVHEIPIGSQRYWQFTMPMIRPLDNEQDEITYEWFRDTGTLQPASLPFQGGTKKMVFPPGVLVVGQPGVFWREAYTRLVVVPPEPATIGQPPPEPTYSFVFTAWADHNGWVSMPGLEF